MASTKAAPTPDRALAAILPLIERDAPYEAHQKARTFASRYLKSAQAAEKGSSLATAYYETTLTILFSTTCALLKRGHTGSGADLHAFLLDVYDQSSTPLTSESVGRLTQIIALSGTGVGSKEGETWRKGIIDKSVAWSARAGGDAGCKAGDVGLNLYVGEMLYKESQYASALPYLLNSGTRDAARVLGQMFVDWLPSVPAGYEGVFALHGVLPYLTNGNILASKTFLQTYIPKLPPSSTPNTPLSTSSIEITLTPYPLVNFAQLAIETCQRAGSSPSFSKVSRESWIRLLTIYAGGNAILNVPEVRGMLQEISSLYFGIEPPRAQAANPMADMMANLFGGGGGSAKGGRRGIVRPKARLEDVKVEMD